jgi:hypothetical protein
MHDWESLRKRMSGARRSATTHNILLDQLPKEDFSPTRISGASLRLKMKLDDLEKTGNKISIVFPQGYVGYTTAFVEGMFGKSIDKFDTKREFDEIYEIAGSYHARTALNAVITNLYISKRIKQSETGLEGESDE